MPRRNRKSAVGFEVLTAEELETLSKQPTDMSRRIMQSMDVDFTSEYFEKFKNALSVPEVTEEVLRNAFSIARSSSAANKRRGQAFENTIRSNILYELRDHQQKLYTQVPTDDNKCFIDFIISNEEVKNKKDINLSDAVIVSTKTRLSTEWREDIPLWARCKAYIMVTLDKKFPRQSLPSDVYFCSPYVTKDTSNYINLNSLIPTIMDYLDDEADEEKEEEEEEEEEEK